MCPAHIVVIIRNIFSNHDFFSSTSSLSVHQDHQVSNTFESWVGRIVTQCTQFVQGATCFESVSFAEFHVQRDRVQRGVPTCLPCSVQLGPCSAHGQIANCKEVN